MKSEVIVLFDGVCNLCEASVIFIIKRDRNSKFKFAQMQSEAGNKLLESAGIKRENFDTMVLIRGGIAYSKSTAVLEIIKELDGCWPLLYVFIIIPRYLRDKVYTFISQHRYKWFGKKEVCMIPDVTIINRFIS